MKVIREIVNYKKQDKPLFVALGNFDGLHKGHQKLIKSLVNKSRAANGNALAFIFDPHPGMILNPGSAASLINSPEIKARLLECLGVDILIYTSFSLEISKCTPEQFVREIIINKLSAAEVFVGFNYSFGFKGAGTPDLLKEMGDKYGFKVNIIPPVEFKHTIVSSTIIRKMLDSGNITEASAFLGYYPLLEGVIIEEEHRGTAIGFPTANLLVDDLIQKPGLGVYAAYVSIEGQNYQGVVNIGTKPTFHDTYPVSIEVHIIDFNQNIYGKKLKVHFVDKIRDEVKFSGVEELVKQIANDKDRAREILGGHLQSQEFYISGTLC